VNLRMGWQCGARIFIVSAFFLVYFFPVGFEYKFSFFFVNFSFSSTFRTTMDSSFRKTSVLVWILLTTILGKYVI
jgi:hypothetical protein